MNCVSEQVPRIIFGPERDVIAGGWLNCIKRSFITCTLHQKLLG
jgi:hypothetical protein